MQQKQSNEIDIVLAANSAYACGMKATLASIVLHCSDRSRLHFHLLDDQLTDRDRAELTALAHRLGLAQPLQFHPLNLEKIAKTVKSYCGGQTAYARLLLPDILPTTDWVLYSDVDVLWFADVCELWAQRDDGVMLLWSRDIPSIAKQVGAYSREWNPTFDYRQYGCSGVALMNLKRMREKNFAMVTQRFLQQYGRRIFFADQDVLNALPVGERRIVHQKWDCMNPCREARESAVVHFNGIGHLWKKPGSYWRPLFAMWYRFYNAVVCEPARDYRLPFAQRFVFWLLGTFYPNDLIRGVLPRLVGEYKTDQICRQLFFAWLLRRAKWRTCL